MQWLDTHFNCDSAVDSIIEGNKVELRQLDMLNQKGMRVADQCIKFLELMGVKYVFGIPAASNLPLYDAVYKTGIKTIIHKNEAGSGYSASHYAGQCTNIGVCILGGTVGVNNAINAIGEAYVNKNPILIISGSPNRGRRDRGGIQNVDTVSITKPITKYSYLIQREDEVLAEIYKAVKIASTPPFGPVHVSIPVDVQNATISNFNIIKMDFECVLRFDDEALKRAIEIINLEDNGIIYVGRGVKKYAELVKRISTKLSWPVIATPCGKGIVEDEFEFYMGNYGIFSTEFTKKFLKEYKSSCLMLLGTSLNEISITDLNDSFMQDKKIIHIDYDIDELNKVFEVDNPVHYDLGLALPELLEKCNLKKFRKFNRGAFNKPCINNKTQVSVRYFIENIFEYLPDKCNIVTDIGEFMSYVIKYLPIKKDVKFHLNAVYGAMGNASGGAVGSHLAFQNHRTVVITGDGGFFMNGMEILTAKE